jgi:hypothetical protein
MFVRGRVLVGAWHLGIPVGASSVRRGNPPRPRVSERCSRISGHVSGRSHHPEALPRHLGILSYSLVTTLLASAPALPACSTTPGTATDRAARSNKTTAFIENSRTTDPSLSKFFDSCVGYASIAKGGFIVVGACLGFCDVSQGSIGAQGPCGN